MQEGKGLVPLSRTLAVPRIRESGLMQRKVSKNQIDALAVWFGQRLVDNSDLQPFEMFSRWAGLRTYVSAESVQTDCMQDPTPIEPVAYDLSNQGCSAVLGVVITKTAKGEVIESNILARS